SIFQLRSNDKTTLLQNHFFTSNLGTGEVSFIHFLVLVKKTMIRGYQDFGKVSTAQEFDQFKEVFKSGFDSLKSLILGFPLIPYHVDLVVINVNNLVFPEKSPPILMRHAFELVCQHNPGAARAGL